MNFKDQLEDALGQFDRLQNFFARVESKTTAIFALNAGLLAILCLNVRPEDLGLWYITVPGTATLLLVGASMVFVYQSSFPNLKGGSSSLVYFHEIAGRTESDYVREVINRPDDDHLRDVLAQVWRNAEILTEKFKATRRAFFLTAIALLPWSWFLVATSITHASIPKIS